MSAMTVVHTDRREGPEHASAVLRLAEAQDEHRLLSGLLAGAAGSEAHGVATNAALGEARARVASRREWLHWIDEGASLAPWADGEWAAEGPALRFPAHETPSAPRHNDHPAVRDALARGRDDASAERDRAATLRDRLADARDEVNGEDRDARRLGYTPHAPSGREIVARAARERRLRVGERQVAAAQRAAAASDREHSERDRRRSADDRAIAASAQSAADSDDLTGALRRGVGLAAVQREIERARRTKDGLVVAFVDVDGLKEVNGSSGHGAGDRLLKRVADLIATHMRPYDVVVRVGGDEFVCSLTGIDLSGVLERFALVSADLVTPPDAGSISIGLAELDAGESIDDVIHRADEALLVAKESAHTGVSRRSRRKAVS
jgi:diguanylate cyclase (GGDEF)-like protein